MDDDKIKLSINKQNFENKLNKNKEKKLKLFLKKILIILILFLITLITFTLIIYFNNHINNTIIYCNNNNNNISNYIPSEIEIEKLNDLKEIINFYQPKNIIQIGVNEGLISNLILNNFNNINNNITLYSYDYNICLKNIKHNNVGYLVNNNKNSTKIKLNWNLYLKNNFTEFIKNIKNKNIDFIIFDKVNVYPDEILYYLSISPYINNNSKLIFYNNNNNNKFSLYNNLNGTKIYLNIFKNNNNTKIQILKLNTNLINITTIQYLLSDIWKFIPSNKKIKYIKNNLIKNNLYNDDYKSKKIINNIINKGIQSAKEYQLNNTKIYIYTHKDFKKYPKNNKNYEILSCNNLNFTNYTLNIIYTNNTDNLNKVKYSLGEVYGIYHLWKYTNLTEYIGLTHYRRYFNFYENLPEIKEDEFLNARSYKMNIYEQYNENHNISDLELCDKIIEKKFPEYKIEYSKIKKLYICNMFIMNKNDFNVYCEFIFGVLDEFIKIKNFYEMDTILNYYHNDTYQARVLGFLTERLTTIFYQTYLKDYKLFNEKISLVE